MTFADTECWAILRDGVENVAHREQILGVCSVENSESAENRRGRISVFVLAKVPQHQLPRRLSHPLALQTGNNLPTNLRRRRIDSHSSSP
jgi:hypothetical protein